MTKDLYLSKIQRLRPAILKVHILAVIALLCGNVIFAQADKNLKVNRVDMRRDVFVPTPPNYGKPVEIPDVVMSGVKKGILSCQVPSKGGARNIRCAKYALT